METVQWDKIKLLGTVDGLIDLTLVIQYYLAKDVKLLEFLNNYEEYLTPYIEMEYQNPFINEVKYNIRKLEPNESADYLKEIINFLYDTDPMKIGSVYSHSESRTTSIKTSKEVFSHFVDKDGKIEYDIMIFIFVTYQLNHTFEFILNSLFDIEKEILNELKRETQKNDIFEDVDPVNLKFANHKVLLLDSLGIIDFLVEKYPVLKENKHTTLARLFYTFFNNETEKALKDLRKDFEGLYNESSRNKTKGKDPIKAVKRELLKVGIDVDIKPLDYY